MCATAAIGFACASAQVISQTPFYYSAPTPFDAQPRMLIVGANQSVGEAVVSGDRRQLEIDPGLLGSAQIRQFSYQKSRHGFVGSAPATASIPPAGNGLTPTIKSSPSEIAPELTVLDKPGMVLISPLGR